MSESTASSPAYMLLEGHDPHRLAAMILAGEPPADPSVTEKPWTTFGGIDLYEEIGRGGMGVVYRARQSALDRDVAVKVLLRAQFASREERERFFRESQAAARLQHPGIVAVHEVGEDEGVPWFSMDYIPGRSLEQIVREHPMSARSAAECVQKVASAIHHAHENGVLHRDLKPSNILMDAGGEPRITDFGIARITANETTTNRQAELTLTGQSLGSPGYAAPEQALHGKADVRTDVYGLGALLYHLLTGRPPFQAPTLDTILVQLRESDPLPPHKLNPSVPRDLETICLKCLHKSPDARYPDAEAVATDLARFLEGKTILARPPSLLGKGWRWSLRHPGIAALFAIIVLLVLGMITSSLAFARHQQRMEQRTTLVSEARSLRLQRRAGARNEALHKLSVAWAIAPSSEIRNEAAACLTQPDIAPIRKLTNASPPLPPKLTLPGIPPGSLIALDDKHQRAAIAAPRSSLMQIIATTDGRLLATCQHPLPLTSLDWSGDLIATACQNRFIYIWNQDGILKHRLTGHEDEHIQVAFRPHTQELASTAQDANIRLWHAARGEEIVHRTVNHEKHIALWWSADGRFLHGGHADGSEDRLEIQDARCMTLLAPPQEEPHTENLGSAAFSPNGRLAAVIDETSCRLWDFATARLVDSFQKAPGQWLSAQFGVDSATLWLSGFDMELTAFPIISTHPEDEITLGVASTPLPGFGNLIRTLSGDGRHLVLSNNGRGEFIVFTPANAQVVRIKHPACLATAIASDGTWLVTSSYQAKGFKVWSLPDGREQRVLLRNEMVLQTQLSPDGNTLICNLGKWLRAFRTIDWTELPLPAHSTLRSISHSPDVRQIVSVGDDFLRLLDASTLNENLRLQLPPHTGWLGDGHALFDADANHLMLHTALGSVIRWDLKKLHTELTALGMAPKIQPISSVGRSP